MTTIHSVILYASQIAACIGSNRHKKPAEAMETMWHRMSPASYAAALERTGTTTEIDRVRAIVDRDAGVRKVVDASMTPCTHSSDVESRYDAAVRTIGSMSDLPASEKAAIDAIVKRNLYTNYGTASEHRALVQIRETLGINARPDSTFYKQCVGPVACSGGTSVERWVGGTIDAITDDRLVIEIKNRIRRLFYKVPFYEIVQLQTYLQLLDTSRGAIVECLSTPDDCRVNIVPVRRDKDLWSTMIVPRMRAFVRVFVSLLSDHAFQDAYLVSPARASMIQTRINAAM